MRSTICVAEDRGTFEPAIKLLILSMQRYCPDFEVNLFFPPADSGFVDWLKQFPQVRLQPRSLGDKFGWNVKPQAMMEMLRQGYDEVIWVDSDIIVNREIKPIFARLSSATLVATEHTLAEERDDRDARRARMWCLPVGRVLEFALSSGVVRVTQSHYAALKRWWDLLQDPKYQASQQKPWAQRPVHMLGDQDVLTAVLTSKEFSGIPLHILRRGKHIIQFDGVYGYTLAERMLNLLGVGPAFIHSGASKPWLEVWGLEPEAPLREYIKNLYLDLSPYTIAALRFQRQIKDQAEWMRPHYALSRIQRLMGWGYPALTGLPMAVFADLARLAKTMRRSERSDPSSLKAGELETAGKH